jgi:hypothetical protein
VLALTGSPPALDAPGWETVREIRASPSADTAALLARPLPSLRVVDGLDLASSAALDLGGIEELRLRLRPGASRAPVIGGFPRLRRVVLESAAPETALEEGLARLHETGLLTRVSEVTLRGFATAHAPRSAIALLAAQRALAQATIDFRRDDWVRAIRTPGKPDLLVSMAMRIPHEVAGEIREVPPPDVSSVQVILSAHGFFARKARPSNARNVRQDLAVFPNLRVTAHPPQT